MDQSQDSSGAADWLHVLSVESCSAFVHAGGFAWRTLLCGLMQSKWHIYLWMSAHIGVSLSPSLQVERGGWSSDACGQTVPASSMLFKVWFERCARGSSTVHKPQALSNFIVRGEIGWGNHFRSLHELLGKLCSINIKKASQREQRIWFTKDQKVFPCSILRQTAVVLVIWKRRVGKIWHLSAMWACSGLDRAVWACEGAILMRLQLPAMLCGNSGVKLCTSWGWWTKAQIFYLLQDLINFCGCFSDQAEELV